MNVKCKTILYYKQSILTDEYFVYNIRYFNTYISFCFSSSNCSLQGHGLFNSLYYFVFISNAAVTRNTMDFIQKYVVKIVLLLRNVHFLFCSFPYERL